MKKRLASCALLIALIVLSSGPAVADPSDDDVNAVNFAYAVFFGTGKYEVDDQTAYVFNVPLSYRIREATEEAPGLRLLLPVQVGFYDFDDDGFFDGGAPSDAGTVSFVPGLMAEYLVSDRWQLKPYGQIGYGRDIENNENSLIYLGGIKSHYRLPVESEWRYALGNTVTYAGYDPDDGASQSLLILGAGIDAISPWELKRFGEGTTFATSLIYYYYQDDPSFEQGSDRKRNVSGEAEWILAMKFAQPRKLLGIPFERIGLGFRYGDNVKGIRVVSEFPF